MKLKRNLLEDAVHGIFLLLGLVTVACVLLFKKEHSKKADQKSPLILILF